MFVLTIISLILILAIWNFSFEKTVPPQTKCIDLSNNISLEYNSCYDAYSKNILLEVKRGQDNYNIRGLKISFFDFSDKSYELYKVPGVNKSKSYKISSDKNPGSINIELDIGTNFLFPLCEKSKKLFINYCPSIKKNGVDVSIAPSGKTALNSFVDVGAPIKPSQDILNSNLVDKKRVWSPTCKPHWVCKNWEACDDGVQRRECTDSRKCTIPINSPVTVKYCGKTCVENWQCEWSNCQNGFTSPKCKDLSHCGTSYNIPHKLKCGASAKCNPNIKCTDWTKCRINYNFADLINNNISNLSGVESRYCSDKNSCVGPKEQSKSCSLGVDVYAKQFTKCGESFIGVYNKLNGKLIARVNDKHGQNPHLNIYLDSIVESKYCDYCFDGIMDGDESGVDCGKSCESCADKYKTIPIKKQGWFDKFTELIKEIF